MNEKLDFLLDVILAKVFLTKEKAYFTSSQGEEEPWIFDFRRVMLRPEVLDVYATIFWEKNKHLYPFQVCGLEVASLPLVSAIVMKSVQEKKPVNGFFIRKSRKKSGLLKMVEGEVLNEIPVILIDDLINSGGTFVRQVEVLERYKHEVDISISVIKISTILRFRDMKDYHYFHERKIEIESFFGLKEILSMVKAPFSFRKKPIVNQDTFDVVWSMSLADPNYSAVRSKGSPCYAHGKVYLGGDSKTMFGFCSTTGKEEFSSVLGYGRDKLRTFSSVVFDKGLLIFGMSDGNIYVLNATTGKRVFVFFDYDYSGGELAYDASSDVLFFHACNGLFKKKSYVVALHIPTQKVMWSVLIDDTLIGHCVVSAHDKMVVVTTQVGDIYALRAHDGSLVWHKKYEEAFLCSGCVDESLSFVIVGGGGMPHDYENEFNGFIRILSLTDGTEVSSFSDALLFISSSPIIHDGIVYVASLNKKVYAYSLTENKILWQYRTSARIFGSPVIINDVSLQRESLFIGTNAGHLLELDTLYGDLISQTIFTERITDPPLYDPVSQMYFLATYANQVYALVRKKK